MNPLKIHQSIQNKYQQYLQNQTSNKEKKVVQIDGHSYLKKTPSKEYLEKVQQVTSRKKVGNIYEDIEEIVDRALSDDDDQNDRLQNLNQAQDEEKYIEFERKELKKKIQQVEQEIHQRKMEQERLEKLKKEFEQREEELKCFCKKVGVKIVKQCELCKELKKLKLIK